ncbi:MAG: restriction endonuclease subunit S [Methanophagales archaeon]|nr:restriction endonuclease subunit S [Methanophagales archaeon]
MKFSDFVITNPKVSLEKGKEYPFIEMEEISPGNRYVSSTRKRMFKGGGSKFITEDVLFARITPSLENGKIAQVKDAAIKGFGSTEFFVFRHREEISDSSFIYYLSFSEMIRKPAEKSMFGASGRQRADLNVVQDLWIEVPPLPTQRKIAAILSAYDDLIENNTRRIQILEEMAQSIYEEWFVKFRFPGHEKVKMVDSELGKIPEGWAVKKVKDIVKRLKAGRTYTQKEVLPMGNIPVVDQSRSEFLGFHNNESDHYASSEEPIIIFGDHTCKMQIMVEPFSLGPNVIPFISNDNGLIYYLFFLVRNLVETHEYKRHWNELVIKKVVLADKKSQIPFSELIKPMAEEINLLRKRNLNLRHARDLLMPKLISGEIDVEV